MPDLPNVFSIAAEGHVAASSGPPRKVVNVWSYALTKDGGGGLDAGQFVAAFESGCWSHVVAMLPNDYRGGQYSVYGDASLSLPPLANLPMGISGGRFVVRGPLFNCLAVRMMSGLRGRSFRGIKRIGPLCEADQVDGALREPALLDWQNAVANCLNVLRTPGGNEFTPCILSRELSSDGPPPAFRGAYVTAVNVNPTLCVWSHRQEKIAR